MMPVTKITRVTSKDIRFPTALEKDGSDAVNDPDYSCVYVTLKTDGDLEGYGITFTIGRGNDIVCKAVDSLVHMVVGQKLEDIFNNFGDFWMKLCTDPQLRWLGPEKGVSHLALAALVNALWDLWGKMEGKPVWKLLADMEPEKLVSVIDFRYITDVLTKEEALEILRQGQEGKAEREKDLLAKGIPAYTTAAGWLGYSDEKVKRLCKKYMAAGFTKFKVKVGLNQEDDVRRCGLVRQEIGKDNILMTDANERWEVDQSIEWMKSLAKFNILWIEEPTNPDDISGHARIAKELAPFGIGVATGEACHNRVMFKQFLEAKALHYCQIDSCRLGGPNEIISVILMAKKFGVPVCPHAGGVGLCELVQHMAMFDFLCVAKTRENRVVEYVDHLHEHFVHPVVMDNAHYTAPQSPGYSSEMKKASLEAYEYPGGSMWQQLFAEGKYPRPQ